MLVRLTESVPVFAERRHTLEWIGILPEDTILDIEPAKRRRVSMSGFDNPTRRSVVKMKKVGDGGSLYALEFELRGRYKKVSTRKRR